MNAGSITDSHATGNVDGTGWVGGLVGFNGGPVTNCFASGSISVGAGRLAGGLVGWNFEDSGPISNSYATGSVTGGDNSKIGGFVGDNDTKGAIVDSYSTGAAVGGSNSYVGGFAGYNDGTFQYAYSTGAPSGRTGAYVGGFVGYDAAAAGRLTDAYWDTDTSGIANLSQGAGNIANDPGITGLTTAQLQSGLPQGFDPAIWGESADINGGLPYLLAIPPPRHP
ncbi:MAG TPA: GLUG motif-containing protein [Rhizomicrobium sp.]|nr:GLUG motif-containing protein [Rhizomicrobium sp.]